MEEIYIEVYRVDGRIGFYSNGIAGEQHIEAPSDVFRSTDVRNLMRAFEDGQDAMSRIGLELAIRVENGTTRGDPIDDRTLRDMLGPNWRDYVE